MEQRRADWVFAAEPRSVPQARTLITQSLNGLPDESLEVVLLLSTELVTNAVRHGTGPVAVHLVWDDRSVRVEVEDQSPERPVVLVQALDDALSGRGLNLVESLATGWGVAAGETSKTVWFTCHA